MRCSRCEKPIGTADEVCLRRHPDEWTHRACCRAEHDDAAQTPRPEV